MGQWAEEKDKTEQVTGLGRRTEEEIANWNQMTALRFQTGRRHQTSPASLRESYNRGRLEKEKIEDEEEKEDEAEEEQSYATLMDLNP